MKLKLSGKILGYQRSEKSDGSIRLDVAIEDPTSPSGMTAVMDVPPTGVGKAGDAVELPVRLWAPEAGSVRLFYAGAIRSNWAASIEDAPLVTADMKAARAAARQQRAAASTADAAPEAHV